MSIKQKITPFLWFDHNAEEAMNLYVSLFPSSRIVEVTRYGEGGPAPKGTVMTGVFELDGQRFMALNGGPMYKFNEAFSLMVDCETQEEVDGLWDKLIAGGGAPSQCGWLKDRFGLSWQIVPSILPRLLGDPDRGKAGRAMQAMLKMTKIDIAALKRAAEQG
jgi:predicted 3-demethylubiquinone-9 3-methyltransferase (glyoxalase superfamily)